MKRLIILVFCALLFLGSCKYDNKQSATKIYFNTAVTITLFGGSQSLLESCFNLCSEYENIFSRTIETSDIGRLNASNGQPVVVDERTIQLLEMGINYGKLSDGAFDITIYPASSLWDFDADEPAAPNMDELAMAAKLVNFKNIEINHNEVMLKNGAKIDLGGIAKGYIADKVSEYLKLKNIKGAIINFGGNIVALGENGSEDGYKIGIRRPFSKNNELVSTVIVEDATIVTSGNYERSFFKNGILYHHILDPLTGMPVNSDLDSVTIIGTSSAEADALSTICYIIGRSAAIELIESMPDVEAVFIDKKGVLSYTSLVYSDGEYLRIR